MTGVFLKARLYFAAALLLICASLVATSTVSFAVAVRDDSPIAARGRVVIGENMTRVKAYARAVAGHTIDDWLAGRPWTQELNDEFIAVMKAQGREFLDIGPDFGRRLSNRINPALGRPPSKIYGGERQQLLDYNNYHRLYERAGKYDGGVPGFDP